MDRVYLGTMKMFFMVGNDLFADMGFGKIFKYENFKWRRV